VAQLGCADRSELDGFSPDGRRWQRPAPALRLRLRDGWVEVTAVPWLRPYPLDPATGRSTKECNCAAR
jgi:hypothetical protein